MGEISYCSSGFALSDGPMWGTSVQLEELNFALQLKLFGLWFAV